MKELTAVVILLPHLQQQPLIRLREKEDVLRVRILDTYRVYLVQHVEEAALRVQADCVDGRNDLADNPLARRDGLPVFQAVQVWQQLLIDERERVSQRTILQ